MSTAAITRDDKVGRLYFSEAGDGKVVALRSVGVYGRDQAGQPTGYTMVTVRDDQHPLQRGEKRKISADALYLWQEQDDYGVSAMGTL